MTIVDKRKGKLIIAPFSEWIPEGVTNYLFDITDSDGLKQGDIEVGTDGFIQVRLKLAGKLLSFNGKGRLN